MVETILIAITAAFPQTEYQRCIVHQVRYTLKYVSEKGKKAFAADLKTIYHAAAGENARISRINLRKMG